MIRDIFYYGSKPNTHPRERFATSLEDALQQCTTEHFWIINEFCDYRGFDWDFDYDFLPDEDVWAQDHNNVWPSQHQKDSGTWLCSKQHSDIIIYRNDVSPVKRKNEKSDKWTIHDLIDESAFDFSWHPDPTSPPYIYVWGNKFIDGKIKPTLEYHTPTATDKKFMPELIPVLPLPNWKVFDAIDQSFDFSWRPDPLAPPYIYVWGNQWYNPEEHAAVKFIAEGATDFKFMPDRATRLPSMQNWTIPHNADTADFDFSWIPHPKSPPYIYQFGTVADPSDGPIYVTPNNTGEISYRTIELSIKKYYIETTLDDLVQRHPKEFFWAMRKNIDYSNFDFDWRPLRVGGAVWESTYVNVFGSPDSETTQTYFVNAKSYLSGNTELKYIENTKLDEAYLSNLFVKSDMFYIDRGNAESQSRFDALKEKFPNIQKTRYLSSWVDTVNRCANRSKTDLLWVLNSELDYTDFDFNYYPNPWQIRMLHVFGTQWSHWGTTFMVNRDCFPEDSKYIKIIEHLSNINFVKSIKARATNCVHDIVLIDFGNKELETVIAQLKSKAPNRLITTIKYNESYTKTLKDIISIQEQRRDYYLWLCSSVCDYSDFDFSYTCDPFARDQLHVFASGKQKFGDTFFIEVNKTREIISEMQELALYNKINFNSHIKAKRRPAPVVIVVNDDTHVNAILETMDFPYTTFITQDNADIETPEIEPMALWSPSTKNIIITSTGATKIIVPKEAKDYVKKELYDYPYIKRVPKFAVSKPLDIVYLSNGEAGAEENWEHLQKVSKGLRNRVVRVDGINGRVAAYHAAVEASETPWCFTVFAKLKINEKFDFSWQPDRMQVPKHYIFHAINPVNGLIYGHQAMIAYNKKLTLANSGKGLDFTLDNEHEVVTAISGTANYNTDEFSTWRTAFREVLKLKADADAAESKIRLNAWLTIGQGNFAEYSIKGAVDAAEYFDEVNGNFDALKLSYEWAWLRERFEKSYPFCL